MSKLIDGDDLVKRTEDLCNSFEMHWTDERVLAWIKCSPAVDVPVQQGTWLKTFDGRHFCDSCGHDALLKFEPLGTNIKGINIIECLTNYCPNCGARIKNVEP